MRHRHRFLLVGLAAALGALTASRSWADHGYRFPGQGYGERYEQSGGYAYRYFHPSYGWLTESGHARIHHAFEARPGYPGLGRCGCRRYPLPVPPSGGCLYGRGLGGFAPPAGGSYFPGAGGAYRPVPPGFGGPGMYWGGGPFFVR